MKKGKVTTNIREKARKLVPNTNFYIKSLHVDMKSANNKYYPNYSFSFIMELVNPTEYSFTKRLGNKRNFTVNGDGIYTRKACLQYLAPLKTSPYTKEEKQKFTRFQSATLALPPYLLPTPCAFNGFKTVIAGVIIEEKDVLASTRLYTRDGNTAARSYDFFTYDEALQYQKNNSGILYSANKMKDYKSALLDKGGDRPNEALVGLSWNVDGSSKIGIMEDNLESRLLAKQYAVNLKTALRKHNLCTYDYTIPIIFYTPKNPGLLFKEYTEEEYQFDCKKSKRLYINSHERRKKYKEERFEFLLGLSIKKQQKALQKKSYKHKKDTLALTLLKSNNIFIFKVLRENTQLSFGDLLKPGIDEMSSTEILSLLDYALRAEYEELALYLYNKLHFYQEISHNILHYALVKNKYTWFEKLLKANIREMTSLGEGGILHHAACKEDVRYITALFKYKQKISYVDKENSDGFTPLMLAAFYGYGPVLNFLLNKSSNYTKVNLAQTLLKENNIFIIKMLQENTQFFFDKLLKPSIDIMPSKKILSIFDYVLRAEYYELASYLYDKLHFDQEISHDILLYTLEYDIYDWFIKLLQKNITEIDSSKATSIIHYASCQDDTRYIKALVKYKKDLSYLEKENSDGFTPLILAVSHGCVNVVNFLLKNAKVNINYRNINGDTALMYAASYHKKILALLLEDNNINIHCINKQGFSAYDFAKTKISMQLLSNREKSLEIIPFARSNKEYKIESSTLNDEPQKNILPAMQNKKETGISKAYSVRFFRPPCYQSRQYYLYNLMGALASLPKSTDTLHDKSIREKGKKKTEEHDKKAIVRKTF